MISTGPDKQAADEKGLIHRWARILRRLLDDTWDWGAATSINVTLQSNTTVRICSGPGVLTGYSVHNAQATACSLTVNDGYAGTIVIDQVLATTFTQRQLSDRGVRFNTELSMVTGNNGPLVICVYVRLKHRDDPFP